MWKKRRKEGIMAPPSEGWGEESLGHGWDEAQTELEDPEADEVAAGDSPARDAREEELPEENGAEEEVAEVATDDDCPEESPEKKAFEEEACEEEQESADEEEPPRRGRQRRRRGRDEVRVTTVYRRAPIKLILLLILLVAGSAALTFVVMDGAKALGGAVGRATGSFTGVTSGVREGTAAGRRAGLSAADTQVDIGGEIKKTGKLAVLRANVLVRDHFSVGQSYDSLRLLAGDLLFTEDLQRAKVQEEADGSLIITLPQPQVSIQYDLEKTKVLAERGKWTFGADAASGAEGYLNSLKEADMHLQEQVDNYEELRQAACGRAEEVVREIASAARPDVSVQLRFAED